MSTLSSTTLRALLLGFDVLGLDRRALSAAARVDTATLEQLDGVFPGSTFSDLWKEAFRQAARAELPTELGFAVPFGAFGAVDYLANSSQTVAAAFESLRAHFRQVGSVQLELVEGPASASVRLVNTQHTESEHLSDEMTLALFVARFRAKAKGPFKPLSVRLTGPAPRQPTRHEALFDTVVLFDCRIAALELPLETWRAPLLEADPGLQLTLRQLAQRLDLGRTESDLELSLRARLRSALPVGDAEATSAAKALGLSERTLHRRLQELGTTWREVLARFREAESERLLCANRATLTDIALQLGFSDQTAWNRAFRRWKGVSPTEWLKARP